MRGDSGKNIYSQVLPHTLAQMDTAKAHTHIAMRCELTAVFPCFISCGNFVSSTESCRSIYYILRCKDTAIWAKHKTFSVFSAKMQSYLWSTSKISGIFCASSHVMGLNLYIFFVVSFPYYVLMWRCPMVISFPCNDEAGKVLLPQEHLVRFKVCSSQNFRHQFPCTSTG